MTRLAFAPLAFALTACGPPTQPAAPCTGDHDCTVRPGGRCLPSPLGSDQCAYPDVDCPRGYSWSDLTGSIADTCVAELDAGIDGPQPVCATPPLVSYVAGAFGTREVSIANSDGSAALTISNNAGDDTDPRWSPDGNRLLFRSRREGNWDIWTAKRDGTDPVNLTPGSGVDEGLAEWSPDGTKIAYVRPSGLWVMASDGTLPTQLATVAVNWISWSPSGGTIGFSTAINTNGEIFTVPVAGGIPVNVTNTPSVNETGSPVWSPDGARFAFSRLAGTNSDIWVANADGSNPNNLTPDVPATRDFGPVWTPTGDELLFTSDREGIYKVFRVAATGGAVSRVFATPIAPGVDGDWMVDIAPDGSRILFTRYFETSTEVGTVAIDGSDQRTFVGTPGDFGPCR